MKRSNKLYETKAIVSQLQSRLMLEVGHNPMKLKTSDRDRIATLAKAAYDSLENLHCELETMIDEMNKEVAS